MNSSNPINIESPQPSQPSGVRLQKVLAAAGYGSRRRCEALIDDGRISVDGQVVAEQGTRIDPATAVVRVDGERISVPTGVRVLALNKPRGMITAMSDDRGRSCVGDLVVDQERLFHVGRLDSDTDGLLLLTNDGDLTHRLTHPSFGVDKTYVAQVSGVMGPGEMKKLRRGVVLDDRPVAVSSARIKAANSGLTVVELVIHEGRNHVVRRLLAEIGFPVQTLTRTKFGPIELRSLKTGALRELSADETTALYDAVDAGSHEQ